MRWTHSAETNLHHEHWIAEQANIWKDGDGQWRATIWENAWADGICVGAFATAKAAKEACEKWLETKGVR